MKKTLQTLLFALIAIMMPIGASAQETESGNDTEYGTTSDAEGAAVEVSTETELIAALANGGNIMLTGDITVSDEYWGGYEITKNTTIDLNGHTITGVHVFTPNPENAGVVLTISGNGTIKATDPYSDMPVDVWGTLNLLSGTIEGSTNIFGTINMYGGWVDELNTDKLNSDDDTSHITGGYVRHLNCWGGIVTISGGHVEALGIKYGRIIISGGTFGFDPTAYLAEGYTATEADGKWAVTCANGCEYTYSDNGDGTHGKVCTECGNVVASEPHTLTYTASGNVITATCSANCGYSETATISAENATYNGTEQTTASIAYSEGWTGGEPTVSYENNVNAGTATASITLGEATASVEFTIAKAEINIDDLVNPEFAKGLIYNGTAQALVTAHGSVPGGTILYSLTYDGEYTTTIPVATEAGNYRVYWTIECDENHYVDVTPGSSRVTIAKAASSITTAPSGKELTYKGYAQALVTAGEAMGGTILYSLDNATWNEEIPVGKEIGDYTVYYKVIGDNNHDDIATQSVTVAIKACEHSYNEDGFCEMCSTANPDETMFFIFDGDHKAFNVAEDLVGVNIEYTRGLHNTEWNSIYLPFEVPVTEGLLDEFEFAYVNDMHSADTDDNGEIDEIEMEIVKIKTGTLHANHPYFIRAKSEYTILQLSYENTTLHATEETTLNCSSIYMDYAIVGSYKHIKGTEFASMPADRYYAISIDGGWWQIPEDSSLYPFRAYLSMTARDGSPVKVSDEAMRSIRIREKGEGTTGIEEVKGENGEVKTIYDLQGRKVEVPSKGLYIINGKKVLIK